MRDDHKDQTAYGCPYTCMPFFYWSAPRKQNGMKQERFTKLSSSVEWSLRQMKPYRELRYTAIQEYTGRLYGHNQDQQKVPINMIEMAVTIYMQHLAAQRPSILINTRFPSLKRLALSFEVAMQDYMRAINIERVFQRTVFNSLFGLGVIKVGDDKAVTLNWDEIHDDPFLSQFGDEENGLVLTRPYAESIDLDDLVIDMDARRLEECRFIGHRYRIERDELAESIPSKHRDRIKTDPRTGESRDRVEDIGKGGHVNPDPFDDMVECHEILLPYDGSVVTFQLDNDKPLNEDDYDGPDGGNYHFLGYHDVSNNPMPLAPISTWLHLHRLGNDTMNKLGDQAQRQKTLALYDKTLADEAQRIKQARDGDAIAASPQAVEEKSFFGPNAVNFGFLKDIQNQFSYYAGNLDLLGGLGAQSETLGQDQMLAGGASKRILDMQTRVMTHYEEVLKSLAWYLYHDDLYDPPLTREIGPGVVESVSFTPEDREIGNILQFDFELVPFSMTHESPSQKFQKLMSVVQNLYMPMMPQAQQQGAVLDMKALFEKAARLLNMEDILPDVLTYSDPANQMELPGDKGSSPFKRSENVRTNRSGATESGKRDIMARNLVGAGAQQSEMDSLGASSY